MEITLSGIGYLWAVSFLTAYGFLSLIGEVITRREEGRPYNGSLGALVIILVCVLVDTIRLFY